MPPQLTENRQEIISPINSIPLTSEKIVADQNFLAEVHGLSSKLATITGNENALAEYLGLLSKFAKFADERMYPVNVALMGKEVIHNDKTKGNEYHPESKELFVDYARENLIGIAAKKQFGGAEMPKSLIGGVALAGFNANPSFYLKEMVTQGALNLLQVAYEKEASNEQKQKMIKNVMSKLISGEYTGAMILTEPKTGANLGNNMECTAQIAEGSDSAIVNGEKKYITGLTTGGIDSVKNAIGLVVSATRDETGKLLLDTKGKTQVSVTIVPIYKIDEKGETILENGQPIPNNVVTSHFFYKPGIENQILQHHNFQGSEGILLGERGNGWPMMFGIMDPARHEVGTQAVAHIYSALELAKNYTANRGLEMRDSQPYAEYPAVAATINKLRAFAETGASVLMDVGLNMDYANIPNSKIPANNSSQRTELLERQAKAQGLIKIETPFVKAYFTRAAKKLMVDATQVMGSDGYTSKQLEKLRNNLEPTPIYEGPNEMMAKQIVSQQYKFIDGFIEQANDFLFSKEVTQNVNVQNLLDVRAAVRDLSEANKWLGEQRILLKSEDPTIAELAAKKIAAASDMFLDLMGAVYMGKEAVKTINYIQEIKSKNNGVISEDLQDRLKIAEAAIHHFINERPSLRKMQEEYKYAEPTFDVKKLIALNKEKLNISSASQAVEPIKQKGA
ncbi:MAG: acyl-CoA dehydrogenase family protein [Rickettsiales bacterium]|nr:acyl-CoA dehydrogenase family protein [Rickettsiales bacterium]